MNPKNAGQTIQQQLDLKKNIRPQIQTRTAKSIPSANDIQVEFHLLQQVCLENDANPSYHQN